MTSFSSCRVQKEYCQHILRYTVKNLEYLLRYSPGGSTRRQVGPGRFIWDPHFGAGHQGPTMVPFEMSDGGFLQALHCDHCTISNQLATICLRCSSQQRVDHFGAKYGEEGVDRCKPNFNTLWERRGAVI